MAFKHSMDLAENLEEKSVESSLAAKGGSKKKMGRKGGEGIKF